MNRKSTLSVNREMFLSKLFQGNEPESLLSKAENGRALPSLPLIHRLVRMLETNISWLFDENEPDDSPVFRAGTRPVATLDYWPGDWAGVSVERIISYKGGHLLQSNIHHIEVGGQSGDASIKILARRFPTGPACHLPIRKRSRFEPGFVEMLLQRLMLLAAVHTLAICPVDRAPVGLDDDA
jgi:hypothetical protein